MRFLVSAGPTRERIDPARFVSNRSSGKMGYAVAAAAAGLGHEVVLVSGPTGLAAPAGVRTIQVESAAEMAAAMKAEAPAAAVVVMAAAVADYRPVHAAAHKLKKTEGNLVLEFERTEDILASLGKAKRPGQLLCGFAAESEDLLANARKKLAAKNLDWIVANDISVPGRGFAVDDNAATMLAADGRRVDFPLQSKAELARRIVATLLG